MPQIPEELIQALMQMTGQGRADIERILQESVGRMAAGASGALRVCLRFSRSARPGSVSRLRSGSISTGPAGTGITTRRRWTWICAGLWRKSLIDRSIWHRTRLNT